MKKRYYEADRKEKSRLLNKMVAVTDLHQKSVIRLVGGTLERKTRCGERGELYGGDVDDALRVIDQSRDYICAERLRSGPVNMAQHLADHAELAVSDPVLAKLVRVSISTVGCILRRIRQGIPSLATRTGEWKGQLDDFFI